MISSRSLRHRDAEGSSPGKPSRRAQSATQCSTRTVEETGDRPQTRLKGRAATAAPLVAKSGKVETRPLPERCKNQEGPGLHESTRPTSSRTTTVSLRSSQSKPVECDGGVAGLRRGGKHIRTVRQLPHNVPSRVESVPSEQPIACTAHPETRQVVGITRLHISPRGHTPGLRADAAKPRTPRQVPSPRDTVLPTHSSGTGDGSELAQPIGAAQRLLTGLDATEMLLGGTGTAASVKCDISGFRWRSGTVSIVVPAQKLAASPPPSAGRSMRKSLPSPTATGPVTSFSVCVRACVLGRASVCGT